MEGESNLALLLLTTKMKHLLVFLLVLLMSATKVDNTPRDFHVSIVGEEKVEQFESKFPQIVKDEAVYIAYLQRY